MSGGRRRRRGMGRLVLRVAIGVFGLAAMGGAAWVVVEAKSGHLFVAEVSVDGLDRLSVDEVLDAAGLAPRVGIFTFDPADVTRSLLAHPWIRSARVRRVLPTRVEVTIRERVAIAVLEAGDLHLVDDEGTAFIRIPSHAAQDHAALVRLLGPRRDGAELNRDPVKRLTREGLALARDVTRVFPRWIGRYKILIHPVLGPRLIHPASESAPELVETRIGRGRWGEKLSRLKLLLEKAEAERRRLELVILDNERHPDRVTARFAAGG